MSLGSPVYAKQMKRKRFVRETRCEGGRCSRISCRSNRGVRLICGKWKPRSFWREEIFLSKGSRFMRNKNIERPRGIRLCQCVRAYRVTFLVFFTSFDSKNTYCAIRRKIFVASVRCLCYGSRPSAVLQKSGKNNKRKVRKRVCCKARSWQRARDVA